MKHERFVVELRLLLELVNLLDSVVIYILAGVSRAYEIDYAGELNLDVLNLRNSHEIEIDEETKVIRVRR